MHYNYILKMFDHIINQYGENIINGKYKHFIVKCNNIDITYDILSIDDPIDEDDGNGYLLDVKISFLFKEFTITYNIFNKSNTNKVYDVKEFTIEDFYNIIQEYDSILNEHTINIEVS